MFPFNEKDFLKLITEMNLQGANTIQTGGADKQGSKNFKTVSQKNKINLICEGHIWTL